MKNLSSIAEVDAGIPAEFRSFFQVAKVNPDLATLPIIESFWTAVALFGRVSRLSRPCKIILDTSPFSVNIGPGVLSFAANDDIYGQAIENLVFIDLKKLTGFSPKIQIATIMEEFVHALMDVKDEDLASKIVVNIYPKINYITGRYVVP